MGTEPRQIEVNVTTGQRTTALLYPAQTVTRRPSTLMLAHGAGAPQQHPFMVGFARALSERGLDVLTFNFLYTEQRRKIPDRMPQLVACYRAVIDAARAKSRARASVCSSAASRWAAAPRRTSPLRTPR